MKHNLKWIQSCNSSPKLDGYWFYDSAINLNFLVVSSIDTIKKRLKLNQKWHKSNIFEYFKAVKCVARYEPSAPIKIGYIQLSYADLLNHQIWNIGKLLKYPNHHHLGETHLKEIFS